MPTGTLLFVRLIPRITRGELKSNFFSLIFFGLTRQTSPTASPEFNFFSKRRFVYWAFRDKDNVSVKQKNL